MRNKLKKGSWRKRQVEEGNSGGKEKQRDGIKEKGNSGAKEKAERWNKGGRK